MAEYLRTWSKFDPEATKLVELHKVPDFLKSLNPPLGCGDDEEELKKVLSNLNLHVIDNHVHFRDLLAQLAVAAIKKKLLCEGRRGVFLALPEKSKVLGRHKDNAVFMKGSYLLSDSSEVKYPDTQILSDVDVSMLEAEKHKKEMEELEELGEAAIKTEKKRRSLEILNWRQQAREVEIKLTIREENERKKRSAIEAEEQMRVNAAAARLRRLAEEEEEERRALVEEEEAEKRRIAAEIEAAPAPAPALAPSSTIIEAPAPGSILVPDPPRVFTTKSSTTAIPISASSSTSSFALHNVRKVVPYVVTAPDGISAKCAKTSSSFIQYIKILIYLSNIGLIQTGVLQQAQILSKAQVLSSTFERAIYQTIHPSGY